MSYCGETSCQMRMVKSELTSAKRAADVAEQEKARPCPVEWGEPSKSSFENPVLTSEEKKSAPDCSTLTAACRISQKGNLQPPDNHRIAAIVVASFHLYYFQPRR